MAKIKGFDKVMRNLNKEISLIEGRTLKGLIRATIIIRRDMDKSAPKIPVDTGNLRSSFYTVTSKGKVQRGQNPSFKGENAGKLLQSQASSIETALEIANKGKAVGPMVVIGFGAYYALYVHEKAKGTSGGAINWNREGSGPHFLLKAISSNHKKIIDRIREEAKVR